MAFSTEFKDFIVEQLEPLGSALVKRMFGGAGLYLDGTIFALLADDVLYLKVDEQNRADFEAEDMEPLSPFEDGKLVLKSYYECPPQLLEDSGELCDWARKSWQAGRRADAAKALKKKKRPTKP